MKSFNTRHLPKKRRGLGTIVGGLIFVVLLVSALSMFGAVLDTQQNQGETANIVANADLKKQQESFKLNVFTDTPVAGQAELHIEVRNEGQNPVEISTVVVAEITDAANNYPATVNEIPASLSFITPQEQQEILSPGQILLDLAAPATEEHYTIKVISYLGTIKTYTVICDDVECGDGLVAPGAGNLVETLFVIGPNAVNTKTSTVVMIVTNASDETVNDVQPFRGFAGGANCNDNTFWTITVSPPPPDDFTEEITGCTVEPNVAVNLGPHEVVIFKWSFTVGGDIDTEFTFCNYATGNDSFGPIDSQPQTCDEVTIIDPNDCDGCGPGGSGDEDILDEKFITRPEIFITFPGPFGESVNGQPDRAMWAANVVNPTDTAMEVHKITITAFPPASNDNFNVVEPGGATGHLCYPQDYIPGNSTIPATVGNAAQKRATEAGFWSCPGSNTIMWKNYDNPMILPAQGTIPFMVKLIGATPISNTGESVLVDSTVYTSSGAFGKGNYQTSTYDNGLYANIFSTTDWTDPLNMDNVDLSRTGITSGSEETFHVVLTDFDTNFGSYINAGSHVVINVPRAFTLVETDMTQSVGFIDVPNANPALADPSVVIHPDNTTQIIATLENNLGDSADEYAVLTFKATAPTVTQTKLMVMYVLANGAGTNGVDSTVNSIGPTHEYILQVVP